MDLEDELDAMSGKKKEHVARANARKLKRLLRPIIGRKEIRYFSNDWFNQARRLSSSPEESFSWYYDTFPIIPAPEQEIVGFYDFNRGHITGEASPTYLAHPAAAQRIKEWLPNVKLIFSLRNPVDRIYSYHRMMEGMRDEIQSHKRSQGAEMKERRQPTFDELVEYSNVGAKKGHKPPKHIRKGEIKKFNRALRLSIYYEQLQHWYKLFPKEQLYILQAERVYKEAITVMHEMEDFLGISQLDDAKWKQFTSKIYNLEIDPITRHFHVEPVKLGKRKYNPMAEASRQALSNFYRPYNTALAKLVGTRYEGWDYD